MSDDQNTAEHRGHHYRADVGEGQTLRVACTTPSGEARRSVARPYSERQGWGYDLAPPRLLVVGDCVLMDCYGVPYKDAGWGAFSLSRLSDRGRLMWTKHQDVHLPTLRRLDRGLLVLHFPRSRFRPASSNPVLQAQLLDPDSGRVLSSETVDIPASLRHVMNPYRSLSTVEVELDLEADPPRVVLTLRDEPGRDHVPVERRRFAVPIPWCAPS